MSKTLFWYVFRDLLKIFIMASGVLAGIMAFGGMFRPLMQYGLNGAQVLQMLGYMMPATQTYSLPIAALFATTMVYGRLAADNEITACRASGISQTQLAQPAFVMGLALAIISIFGLMWVVPHFSLKVEKVAFQSMAEFVRKSIERTHQVKLESLTIFAETAEILPPPTGENADGRLEAFILSNPVFCSYREQGEVRVPDKFYTAKQATVVIRQGEDNVEFSATLDDGTTFPREFEGEALGGVGATQFGPVPVSSPIRENTKFMTIEQLRTMHADPKRSREIRKLYGQITQFQQEEEYLATLTREVRQAGRQLRFVNGNEEVNFILERGARQIRGARGGEMSFGSEPETRHIKLLRKRGGRLLATDEARQATIKVQADAEKDVMRLEFTLEDVKVALAPGADEEAQPTHNSFVRYFAVPMPAQVQKIEARGPGYYLTKDNQSTHGQNLKRKLSKLQSGITAEMHGRASFGVSCFILVLVGSALGMMFKTGNFLNAFALSVMPALLCIALMITGQHVAEADAKNLTLGLSIIWSGNVLVLVLGIILFTNLRRQ